ncbi:hypothetical protein M514_14700 [Trichuris suis]|uniref:Uncharacterized protein n=1 Tax=Trichuris suis TaxID=68888 RepID=A0A085NV64_9BILA|nr:hypothetical protein M514_14700 [Trichuris suis]
MIETLRTPCGSIGRHLVYEQRERKLSQQEELLAWNRNDPKSKSNRHRSVSKRAGKACTYINTRKVNTAAFLCTCNAISLSRETGGNALQLFTMQSYLVLKPLRDVRKPFSDTQTVNKVGSKSTVKCAMAHFALQRSPDFQNNLEKVILL